MKIKINDLNNGIFKKQKILNLILIQSIYRFITEKKSFWLFLDFYKEKLIFMYANGSNNFIENYSSSPTIREIKTNFHRNSIMHC